MFEIFLDCTIASMIRMKYLSFNKKSDIFHSVFSIAMLTTMILFMVGISAFLYFNKQDIRSKKFVKKYGELTHGLNFRYRDALLAPPFFLLRRIIYAYIVIYMLNYNYF